MAAPHVAGLAALVLAHHPDFRGAFQARNARRVERLFAILKETAMPLGFGDVARTGAGLPYAPSALGLRETASNADGAAAAAAAAAAIQQLLAALSRQASVAPQTAGPPAAPVQRAPAEGPPTAGEDRSLGEGPRSWHWPPHPARGPARTAAAVPQMALQSAGPPTAWAEGRTLQELRSAMMQAGLL
jgi:subtilisin family serine protease